MAPVTSPVTVVRTVRSPSARSLISLSRRRMACCVASFSASEIRCWRSASIRRRALSWLYNNTISTSVVSASEPEKDAPAAKIFGVLNSRAYTSASSSTAAANRLASLAAPATRACAVGRISTGNAASRLSRRARPLASTLPAGASSWATCISLTSCSKVLRVMLGSRERRAMPYKMRPVRRGSCPPADSASAIMAGPCTTDSCTRLPSRISGFFCASSRDSSISCGAHVWRKASSAGRALPLVANILTPSMSPPCARISSSRLNWLRASPSSANPRFSPCNALCIALGSCCASGRKWPTTLA